MLLLNEVINYQQNPHCRIDSSLEIKQQGNYRLENYHIQNYTDSEILIEKGNILGRIYMGTNDKIFINPCAWNRVEMEYILENMINSKINTDSYSLISSVANMLEAKQFKYKNINNFNWEQQIVKIKSMVTNIKKNGSKLQQDDPALKKLNFNKQWEKLNCILLSQYLINNGH